MIPRGGGRLGDSPALLANAVHQERAHVGRGLRVTMKLHSGLLSDCMERVVTPILSKDCPE